MTQQEEDLEDMSIEELENQRKALQTQIEWEEKKIGYLKKRIVWLKLSLKTEKLVHGEETK